MVVALVPAALSTGLKSVHPMSSNFLLPEWMCGSFRFTISLQTGRIYVLCSSLWSGWPKTIHLSKVVSFGILPMTRLPMMSVGSLVARLLNCSSWFCVSGCWSSNYIANSRFYTFRKTHDPPGYRWPQRRYAGTAFCGQWWNHLPSGDLPTGGIHSCCALLCLGLGGSPARPSLQALAVAFRSRQKGS